jgi:anti-sigma regulatory factor (Ser/Thr protein kinase)
VVGCVAVIIGGSVRRTVLTPASLVVDLVPGPRSASQARRLLDATLGAWGRGEDADAGRLALSELVSNAERHGAPPVTLFIEALPDGVRVAVRDAAATAALPSPDAVHSAPADPDAESGRGLAIVARVSSAWGWVRSGRHKDVWFILRDGPPPR